MKKFRPFLPDVLMVAIMVAVALLYMSPVFQGRTLPQGDVMHAQDQMAEIQKFQDETGVYPGWTNSAFSGMPTYQLKSPPSKNVFSWLFRALKLFLPGYTVAILFVSLLGFYVLLRTLKLKHWLALAGALAFGLSSHHIQLIGTGHVNKIYSIAFLAPVIAGMLLVFKRKYIQGGLLTVFALGIQIFTNHVQVTYYLGIIILIYLIVEFVYALKEKYFDHFVKASLVLFVALILAVLPNMTMLLTTYEYAQETTRGKSVLADENSDNDGGLDVGYMTSWSYGIGESLNLFIPNLYGGSDRTPLTTESATYKDLQKRGFPNARQIVEQGVPTYWGGQPFTAGPHYVGAIIIFLAIMGLLLIRGPKKWWLIAIIVLSLMLAWGKNFMVLTEFFANNVPLYAKFRDMTNNLLIAQFAIPLLAFLGIRAWFMDEKRDDKDKLKKLYIGAGIAGGVALIFTLLPGMFLSFSGFKDAGSSLSLDALMADRETLARKDAFRSLIFVLLGAGVLWASLKTKLKESHLYIALVLFILIDLWAVDKRYLNNDNFISSRQMENLSAIQPADQTIHIDKDLGYRVVDLSSRDPFRYARPSRYHNSIGGYHAAKLGRYQDIIDRYLFLEVNQLLSVFGPDATQEIVMNAVSKMKIHAMLNTKYAIYNPNAAPFPIPGALGSAWFAEARIVSSAQEEIAGLGVLDLSYEATVHEEFTTQLADLGSITPSPVSDIISLDERLPNYLKYSVSASNRKLAVFSEIWYPHGWKAYIDGEETEILRANYVLRALVIPEGEHQVEFRFKSTSLSTGQAIAMIGSILVILLLLAFGYITYRKKKA